MAFIKNEKVRNAFYIGLLCSVSYLAVYFARNILSTVSPQMIASGSFFTEEYIGKTSSLYFIFYAIGQLINGIIGDKIKARYMISFGLFLAGVANLSFTALSDFPGIAMYAYSMCGFFLAMIYGPMTKVVAENTEPVYATRCSLGYTFSSFFGSPLAGVAAAVWTWQSVFVISSATLFVMAVTVFSFFLYFEKKGIVKYGQYKTEKKKGGSVGVLIKYRIIKFTFVSALTGVIRTTVVFWMPTYFCQYLGYSETMSASIFTVATLVIAMNAFVSIFVFERLKRNMDLTMLLSFTLSVISFIAAYVVKQPGLNIIFIVLAIFSSNCAATMLWSRYCPSLRDTGMVSGATGFLDFISYTAASVSSTLFANAVSDIGWGNLILVWAALALCGVIVSLPFGKKHSIEGA